MIISMSVMGEFCMPEKFRILIDLEFEKIYLRVRVRAFTIFNYQKLAFTCILPI